MLPSIKVRRSRSGFDFSNSSYFGPCVFHLFIGFLGSKTHFSVLCKEHLGSWVGTLSRADKGCMTPQPFQLSTTGFTECGRWQPLKMTSLLWLSLVPQAPWLEMGKKHLVVWRACSCFSMEGNTNLTLQNLGSHKNGKISILLPAVLLMCSEGF